MDERRTTAVTDENREPGEEESRMTAMSNAITPPVLQASQVPGRTHATICQPRRGLDAELMPPCPG